MNDLFEKKVRAAAVAAWWTVLSGYALLFVTWFLYLVVLPAPPGWLLAMWERGGVSLRFMQIVSLWFMFAFKLFLWFLFLAALWLTLWARQLRKMDGKAAK